MFGVPSDRRNRLKFRGGRFKPPMINRLIPNALTIAAMCAGLTSIRFGMLQRWDLAIFAIVVKLSQYCGGARRVYAKEIYTSGDQRRINNAY